LRHHHDIGVLEPCAVPKLAVQALNWYFSTKDMIELRAARRQYLTLDTSPAKIDDRWHFMIRTGQVPNILRRGDKRTASESPRDGQAPLRRKASSRAMRRVLARHSHQGTSVPSLGDNVNTKPRQDEHDGTMSPRSRGCAAAASSPKCGVPAISIGTSTRSTARHLPAQHR
jgi:hypothetical protein